MQFWSNPISPTLDAAVNKRNLSTGETRDSTPNFRPRAENQGVEFARRRSAFTTREADRAKYV